MNPSQRLITRWPFVILLLALFGLSVAAPRAWQRSERSSVAMADAPRETAARTIPPQPEPMAPLKAPQVVAVLPEEVPPTTFTPQPPEPVLPRPEEPVAKITEQFSAPPIVEVARRPAQIENNERFLRSDEQNIPDEQSPNADAGHSIPSSEPAARPEHTAPVSIVMVTPDPIADRLPAALLEELEALATLPEGSAWARAAGQRICLLARQPLAASTETTKLLAELRKLANDAPRWAAECSSEWSALGFHRAGYSLTRRLDIWDRLYRGALPMEPTPVVAADGARMIASLSRLDGAPRMADGRVVREWLLLDVIRKEARNTQEANLAERRAIAQGVLLRIKQTKLAAGPRQTGDEQALAALEAELRHWIGEPVTAEQCLRQVEQFERSRAPTDSKALAELAERLRYAESQSQQELGQYLELHYRNANLRVAIGERLLNRMAPPPTQLVNPVSDVIGGVPVEGVSTTSTSLQVKLIPDPRCLRLDLLAIGTVTSQTSSSSGPATFRNQGDARFSASKTVSIQPEGIRVKQAEAVAQSDARLQDLNTSFDGVPLISSAVRGMATKQYNQRQGETRWEVEGKISAQVRARLDQEVDQRLAALEHQLKSRILKPLEKLDLNPAVTSLNTTEQRLTMRLRLAADEQLGAFTPRPQAPHDSWASVQIHQSAINNSLAQLKLEGRTFTPVELQKYLADKLDAPNILTGRGDLPDDVRITFAEQEPIKVEIGGGRLTISVAIAELVSDKNRFTNFTGRVHYRAAPEGMQAALAREGVLELAGEKLNTKAQIGLRGLLSKMFPKDKRLQLLPEKWVHDPRIKDLNVTQCALEDGWIGVAVAPVRTAQKVPPVGKKDSRG